MSAHPIAVIAAQPGDVHAHGVQAALESLGAEALLLDVAQLTTQFHLSSAFAASGCRLELTDPDGERIVALDDIVGLWWRRPYGYAGNPRAEEPGTVLEDAVRAERRAALIGSLDALVGNAFNDLAASRRAARKPRQLVRAMDLGLTVPRTVVTNDPRTVREFHRSTGGRTVCKMFHGSPLGLYGTRRLDQADLDHLDELVGCPAIFQEHVDGLFDVRAVVVGDRLFAARIDFDRRDDVVDSRFVDTRVTPHVLPEPVAGALIRLVREAGLVYSAIDLRCTDGGGYVFFESNPEGQYLWIEIEAGLPISRAIADRLLAGAADRRPHPPPGTTRPDS
ncbi:hypothetical protein ACWFNE_00810 [Cellulomonas sp. NPDC055163]